MLKIFNNKIKKNYILFKSIKCCKFHNFIDRFVNILVQKTDNSLIIITSILFVNYLYYYTNKYLRLKV